MNLTFASGSPAVAQIACMILRKTLLAPVQAIAIILGLMGLAVIAPQSPAKAVSPVGLYGYHKQSEAGAIPREYGIVVYHYYSGSSQPARALREVRELNARGHRVIIDFEFMLKPGTRNGKTPLPPLRDTALELRKLLYVLREEPLEGITLDEENRIHPDQLTYLSGLYDAVKPSFPDRRFIQWLTFQDRHVDVEMDRADIPADGWAIDPYLMDDRRYRMLVDQISRDGLPIYSTVWASPGWQVGRGKFNPGPRWWNEERWKVFHNRLAVNQSYGVETILFTYALKDNVAHPLGNGDTCDRAFERQLLEETLPYFARNQIPLATPRRKPAWIPAYCQG